MMKRILLCLVVVGSQLAGWSVDLSGSAGLRRDGLKWRAALSERIILSELAWDNVDSLYVSTRLGLGAPSGAYYFELGLGAGGIFCGDKRDSDYCRVDRGGEWSRTRSDVGGFVADCMVTLGQRMWRWFGLESHLAWQITQFRNYGLRIEVIDVGEEYYEPRAAKFTEYPGVLISIYTANWFTGQSGIRLFALEGSSWNCSGHVRGGFGLYEGRPDWRLRGAQWRQTAMAGIVSSGLDLVWRPSSRLRYGLSAEGSYAGTLFGTSESSNRPEPRVFLDHCRWWSARVTAGVNYSF